MARGTCYKCSLVDSCIPVHLFTAGSDNFSTMSTTAQGIPDSVMSLPTPSITSLEETDPSHTGYDAVHLKRMWAMYTTLSDSEEFVVPSPSQRGGEQKEYPEPSSQCYTTANSNESDYNATADLRVRLGTPGHKGIIAPGAQWFIHEVGESHSWPTSHLQLRVVVDDDHRGMLGYVELLELLEKDLVEQLGRLNAMALDALVSGDTNASCTRLGHALNRDCRGIQHTLCAKHR